MIIKGVKSVLVHVSLNGIAKCKQKKLQEVHAYYL